MSERIFEQPGRDPDDALEAPDLEPLRAAAEQELAAAVTNSCRYAAVAVSLTGSRTVLSPKSATSSNLPPSAST
jgi:hypothetical protein